MMRSNAALACTASRSELNSWVGPTHNVSRTCPASLTASHPRVRQSQSVCSACHSTHNDRQQYSPVVEVRDNCLSGVVLELKALRLFLCLRLLLRLCLRCLRQQQRETRTVGGSGDTDT